jgi:hypothetical protein
MKRSCGESSTRSSPGPSRAEFASIFENCCRQEGIAFDPVVVDYLIATWHQARNIALRGCHPRDLIKQALALAEYLDRPRELTPELIDGACYGYFVHEEPSLQESA